MRVQKRATDENGRRFVLVLVDHSRGPFWGAGDQWSVYPSNMVDPKFVTALKNRGLGNGDLKSIADWFSEAP